MTFMKMNKEIESKSIAIMLDSRRYKIVEEKIYLTSDQYVVKLLGDREKEIAKLNEKYDDLLKRYVVLQVKEKKFEQVKQMFALEETSSGGGYQITVRDNNGSYQTSIAYCWNKKEPSKDFLELLDLLGLELPKEQ